MLAVVEYLDLLADALRWPRSRPARLVLGDRGTLVTATAMCVNDAAIDGVQDPDAAVVLAAPAGAAFARAGRRTQDVFVGEGPAAEWARSERVVIDASEMLAGGRAGFDEHLAVALGLAPEGPMASVPLDEVKFVMYVPADALGPVRSAVFEAGAGMIGEYRECSWSTSGTGTFRGSSGSNPTVGAAGEFEEVTELRVETVCRAHLRDRVARAFVAAHPYEEPAYDVYPLLTPSAVGLGRIAPGVPFAELQSRLQQAGLTIVTAVEGARAREAGNAKVALTSGAIGALLPAVLAEPAVATVVGTHLTQAEGNLLRERGISFIGLRQQDLLERFGSSVSELLSARTGVATRLVAPLAFPGAQA